MKPKYLLLIPFLMFKITLSDAQFDNYWSTSIGEKSVSAEIIDMAKDSEGNLIITGHFSGQSLYFSDTVFVSGIGQNDVFIAKYSSDGIPQWAKTFGHLYQDVVYNIASDENDNIYIAGYFRGGMGKQDQSDNWPFNSYLAKYSSNGTELWSRISTDGTNNNSARAVSVDNQNNIVVSGVFYNKLTFGNITLQTSGVYQCSYICKYDPEGNLIWAKSYDNLNYVSGITVYNDNSIVVSGAIVHPEPSDYSYYSILAVNKYDEDGNQDWTFTDTSINASHAMKMDADENIYTLSNQFETGTWTICASPYFETNSFNITKIDGDGNLSWSKEFEGAWAYDMEFDSVQNIIVSGEQFKDQLIIGKTTLNRNTDSSHNCAYYPDMLFIRFDTQGNAQHGYSVTGTLDDKANNIIHSQDGKFFISGTFESYSIDLGSKNHINNSKLNVFAHASGIYYDRTPFTILGKVSFNDDIPDSVEDNFYWSNRIKMYPNPASHNINFDFGDINDYRFLVKIYNLKGQLVYNGQFDNDQGIDVHYLDAGVYTVHITFEHNDPIVRKLIIK